MDKQAILVASFGTSHDDTRSKTIEAVEREVAAAFPGWQVARAFTSPTIIRILGKRGIQVDDIPQAMARLAAGGVRDLIVQPTHLLCGEEYDRLCEQVAQGREPFTKVRIASPLLYAMEDYRDVAQAVTEALPASPGQALALMGHGTAHFANAVYPAFDYVLREMGRDDAFVGTVEGEPGLEELLARMQRAGYRRALLAPLMLVAGDHAKNDMAGPGPDSWKSRLEAAGIAVEACLRGLGEYPRVRAVYLRHLRQAMES